MTRSSKPAIRNATPAIANRIGWRILFQTSIDRAPDSEGAASLIADMPPRLAATEVGMDILVLLWPGRVLSCRASPNLSLSRPAYHGSPVRPSGSIQVASGSAVGAVPCPDFGQLTVFCRYSPAPGRGRKRKGPVVLGKR